MKKHLALLLAAILLLAQCACAETPDTFTFLQGVSWTTTPDELEPLLGETLGRTEDSDDAFGTLTLMWLDAGTFAGFECDRIMFLFFNDALANIICYYTEDEVSDLQALIANIEQLYGKSQALEGYSLPNLFSSTKTECVWKIGEDTEISLIRMNVENGLMPQTEEYPYFCIVSFNNLPVSLELDKAASNLD